MREQVDIPRVTQLESDKILVWSLDFKAFALPVDQPFPALALQVAIP